MIDITKLTPEEITQFLVDLGEVGLPAMGQPQLAALVPIVGALAMKVEKAIEQPNPSTILSAEVEAADAAADALEQKKFGGP